MDQLWGIIANVQLYVHLLTLTIDAWYWYFMQMDLLMIMGCIPPGLYLNKQKFKVFTSKDGKIPK